MCLSLHKVLLIDGSLIAKLHWTLWPTVKLESRINKWGFWQGNQNHEIIFRKSTWNNYILFMPFSISLHKKKKIQQTALGYPSASKTTATKWKIRGAITFWHSDRLTVYIAKATGTIITKSSWSNCLALGYQPCLIVYP